MPDDFRELDVEDGRIVNFFGVVPLHEDEMEFKLEKGADALFDLFDEHEVTELLVPDRRVSSRADVGSSGARALGT